MNTRSVILERAAELLASSPTGDISTRAVCEAAGVKQPVLYRHFGDKDGLLAAVIDQVWAQYLEMKRAAEHSADPLQDLRAGWDNHTAFALANPHAYRLLFGTGLSTKPQCLDEAMGLLREILDRLAVQGRLALDPADAARIVMAANSGVALALILRGDAYPDLTISTVTRDATLRGILVAGAAGEAAGGADLGEDRGASGAAGLPADREAAETAQALAATTLRAGLAEASRDAGGHAALSPAEAALFDEWLTRIQTRASQASDTRG